MRKLLLLSAVALSLAACQKQQPTVIDPHGPDPLANQLANAAPVELPPAIKASVTFRCKPDNSLAFVDFFSGDKQATLRTKKDGTPVVLKAEKAGDPYTAADGTSLKGDEKSVTIKLPGKGELSCHV